MVGAGCQEPAQCRHRRRAGILAPGDLAPGKAKRGRRVGGAVRASDPRRTSAATVLHRPSPGAAAGRGRDETTFRGSSRSRATSISDADPRYRCRLGASQAQEPSHRSPRGFAPSGTGTSPQLDHGRRTRAGRDPQEAPRSRRGPARGLAGGQLVFFGDRIVPFGREEARIWGGSRPRSATMAPICRSPQRHSRSAPRWQRATPPLSTAGVVVIEFSVTMPQPVPFTLVDSMKSFALRHINCYCLCARAKAGIARMTREPLVVFTPSGKRGRFRSAPRS